MKFTIPTKPFREVFAQAASACPTRTPKEILKNVKVSAARECVTLIGQSDETAVRIYCDAQVESPGDCLLPAARVKDWLSKVTADSVTMSVTDGKALLQCGAAKINIGTESPDGFPEMATFNADSECSINGGCLTDAIRKTAFAADVESTRYALGGVCIEWDMEYGICLTATDSRRLSTIEVAVPGTGEAQFVVPVGALKLAVAFLSPDDDADIAVCKSRASITCGEATVVSKLVEGRFPRWRDVIPKHETAATINAGCLASAIAQASVVTNEESRGVDFAFTEGLLSLTASGADVGNAEVELPIQWDGGDITLTLDGRFLAEACRVLPPEASVEVYIGDKDSPILMVAGNWRYVVMPLSRDA